jgi:hypothetical protein
MAEEKQQPRKRQKAIILLSVLLALMVGASILLLMKYRQATSSNPVTQQQQLTDQLSKLIEMPPDAPVISTVLDSSKLTNKALAARARNGDKLFIFSDSKRLVLYRPSDNKVVDMLNIQTR